MKGACQGPAAGLWFYPDTLVSPTIKIDCYDILTEILLTVALNTLPLIQLWKYKVKMQNLMQKCTNLIQNNAQLI
jgi:hypothetical protein